MPEQRQQLDGSVQTLRIQNGSVLAIFQMNHMKFQTMTQAESYIIDGKACASLFLKIMKEGLGQLLLKPIGIQYDCHAAQNGQQDKGCDYSNFFQNIWYFCDA